MGVGQLSESDAVDALRLPFYSSSHPTGSHGWRNQFDLGNPDFVERLWRSLKYEEVYLKAYNQIPEARVGIGNYLSFYNEQQPHQALHYQTPAEVYLSTATTQDAGLSLSGTSKLPN